MSEPRFHTVETSGYGGGIGSTRRVRPTIHVYVLDRVYAHREIARYVEDDAAPLGVQGWPSKAQKEAWTRRLAAAECARLNAEHEAWLTEAVV